MDSIKELDSLIRGLHENVALDKRGVVQIFTKLRYLVESIDKQFLESLEALKKESLALTAKVQEQTTGQVALQAEDSKLADSLVVVEQSLTEKTQTVNANLIKTTTSLTTQLEALNAKTTKMEVNLAAFKEEVTSALAKLTLAVSDNTLGNLTTTSTGIEINGPLKIQAPAIMQVDAQPGSIFYSPDTDQFIIVKAANNILKL